MKGQQGCQEWLETLYLQGLKKKIKRKKKQKRKRTDGSRTPPCSKTFQFMELCPQTSINTGFLNTVPAFVHNHFTFLFALEEGSINEFFSTKKTLEKEEDNALFSKVYIFSRTNYNLQLAKTCPAMTPFHHSNSSADSLN